MGFNKQESKRKGIRVASFWFGRSKVSGKDITKGSFSNTADPVLKDPEKYTLHIFENNFKQKETDPDLLLTAYERNVAEKQENSFKRKAKPSFSSLQRKNTVKPTAQEEVVSEDESNEAELPF